MNKKIGIMAVMAMLVIGMTGIVLADPTTPTCTFVTPSSNNVELTSGGEGINIITTSITTNVNATNATFTISPLHNATKSQIIATSASRTADSDNFTWSAIYSKLDDAVYTLDVTAFFENNSVENALTLRNLTVLNAACTSRSFIVDTTEGSILPIIAAQEALEDKGIGGFSILIFIAIAGGIYLVFIRKS